MHRFKILFGLSFIVSTNLPAEDTKKKASIRLSNDDLISSPRKSSSITFSNTSSNRDERSMRRSTNPNEGKIVSSKPDDIKYAQEAYAGAQKGDVEAQCILAYSYRNGKGIAQNDAEALKWYLQSANHGYGPAMSELTHIYANGLLGAPKDIEKAYWWECVNRLTPRYGGQNLMVVGGGSTKFVNSAWSDFKSVESLLTPAQISSVQERAQEYFDQLPKNREKALEKEQQAKQEAEVERKAKQQQQEYEEQMKPMREKAAEAERLRKEWEAKEANERPRQPSLWERKQAEQASQTK